jgi:hypothetical protein
MRIVSAIGTSTRHIVGVGLQALLVVAIVAALAFAAAAAAGGAPGGAHSVFAARGGQGGHAAYPGTLVATPSTLQAGDYFDVTGCGYDTALGNVIIGFTGGGWGSPLDENGCFTIAGIPALSGDTLPAGTYEVTASQYVHNKWIETGDTTVTVIP